MTSVGLPRQSLSCPLVLTKTRSTTVRFPRMEVKASASSDGSARSGGNLPKWKTIRKSRNQTDDEASASGEMEKVEIKSEDQGNEEEVVVHVPSSPHLFAYPEGSSSASVWSLSNTEEVALKLADIVEELSNESIQKRGVFSIVLSGGSLVKALKSLPGRNIPWDRWHVFWADERVVPLTDDDSNYKGAKEAFLSKVGIPASQIHAIDDSLPVTAAAEDYEGRLEKLVAQNVLQVTSGSRYPRFDLILLGLGPDGHVASLFPNSPLMAAKDKWVLPISNSPKPPPERITLSLPAINSAKNVVFVATGQGKAFVVSRVLERAALPGSLPAQSVRPYAGTVAWIIDSEAASELKEDSWSDARSFPFINFN